MSTTTGRRRADGTDLADLMPGDYAWDGSRWTCSTPNGLRGDLVRHEVTEHANGTITVNPSILVEHPRSDGVRSWHGYLEAGVWRSV